MLKKLTAMSNTLMQRYLPDPYLFVVLLTLLVLLLALILTPAGPVELVYYWGNGFWGLLTFAMQMVLVLVTGHVMASSPPFKRLLGWLASKPKKPGQAILFVTIVSMLASFINWGFGLVIGALFAKELAKKVEKVDYRLLIASAYSGFIVWHGGLSGSIPLTIATEGHFSQDLIGIIPTIQTIFAPFNLFIVLVLFVVLPMTARWMYNPKQAVTIDSSILEKDQEPTNKLKQAVTPAEKLEQSVIVSAVIGLMGIIFIFYYFTESGFNLNLNIVNFIFLFAGILLHGRPVRFLAAVQSAVKGASGIIIQFPFYAGIMGMMVSSGLAQRMSEWFVAISNEVTFPVFTFISAGIVNVFVPSGGGQWAVQAPIMLQAGAELNVATAKTAMAVAWGDAWTNLIQPFWALPALAIAGLKAKDILGYCLIILFISGLIISLGLLLIPS